MNTKYSLGDIFYIPFSVESLNVNPDGVSYFLKHDVREGLTMNYPVIKEKDLDKLSNKIKVKNF